MAGIWRFALLAASAGVTQEWFVYRRPTFISCVAGHLVSPEETSSFVIRFVARRLSVLGLITIGKMEDRYVVLLEKGVAENVRLREAIEARDNQQRQMLEELSSKMESSKSAQERSRGLSRKRTRNISIPQQCCVSKYFC